MRLGFRVPTRSLRPRIRLAKSSAFAPLSTASATGRSATVPGKDKVVVTCSVNGVLTDPARFSVPVTPDEMAVLIVRTCAL